MILRATIDSDAGQPLTLTGEWSRACRGARDAYGAPLEPDTEAALHVLEAVDARGETRPLSAAESARAQTALWEAAQP